MISSGKSAYHSQSLWFINSFMRLIWKRYDSEFDPIVTAVGLTLLFVGGYMFVLLVRFLRNPVIWVLAAVPLLASTMGAITVIREYQLWKQR